MASSFLFCYLTKVEHILFTLASASTVLGKEASNVKLSAQHVNVRIGDGGNPTQSG